MSSLLLFHRKLAGPARVMEEWEMSSIAERLRLLEERLQQAVTARKPKIEQPGPVCLVAVSKNHSAREVQEAAAAGVAVFGENRVQEALPKLDQVGPGVQWHLIGHLQRNKAKQAVGRFALIHSVDSERLLRQLEEEAARLDVSQDILLQVNVSGEPSKFGMAPEEVLPLALLASTLPHLRVCGLMTVAPCVENAETVRPVFQKAYQLFASLRQRNIPRCEWRWLSMGMSNDYEVAIQEGANMIRVGTALFGARDYGPKEEV